LQLGGILTTPVTLPDGWTEGQTCAFYLQRASNIMFLGEYKEKSTE